MGGCDKSYHLSGSVELDEDFFTVELQGEEKNKPLKRERGNQRKAKILVMVESSNSIKAPGKGNLIKWLDTSKCRSYPIWGRRQLPKLSKNNWSYR